MMAADAFEWWFINSGDAPAENKFHDLASRAMPHVRLPSFEEMAELRGRLFGDLPELAALISESQFSD